MCTPPWITSESPVNRNHQQGVSDAGGSWFASGNFAIDEG
jgi:hypothetical protein